MNIPIVPSDNLYRFLMFTGLLVAVYSLTFIQNNLHKLVIESIEVSADYDKVRHSLDYLEDNVNKLDSRVDSYVKIKIPTEVQKKTMDELLQKSKDLVYEQELKTIEMNTKMDIFKVKKDMIYDMKQTMWVLYIISCVLVIIGLLKWIQQQRYQDRILKNEYLKSQNSET